MADLSYTGKEIFNGGKTNPDLQKERDTATFDITPLKHYLNGGLDTYTKKMNIAKLLFKEASMRLDYDNVVSDVERFEIAFKRTRKMVDLALEQGWDNDDLEVAFQLVRVGVTIGVHGGMFIPALERLSTPEQQQEWLPKAMTLQIIGTYCQTELGHGTNLRGLEATATYDPTTQEFVLNSNKLSGMKWWPGGLGKTCNYVLLLVPLFIGKKNCGMQPFILQIRDMDTHMPLPGIEVGGIGERVGLKFTDNGYLLLKDVRIPRKNMLMRNSQVTPEGEFISRVSSKATYGTMVMMRAKIVGWCYGYMSQCVTIAIRYSAVRRQSDLKPGAPEPQVLDFWTQQYKVFPALAETYAVFFAQKFMLERYEYIDETEIKHNNLKSLPELHSLSCGLKSFCSEVCVNANEVCRRSCGGHGFLIASGVAQTFLDSMATVTYEGENTVLYLQTARYLIREFSSIANGEKPSGTWAYLSESYPPSSIRTLTDCDDLTQLTNAFKRMAKFVVSGVAQHLQNLLDQGLPQYEAWNQASVHLVRATKMHMEAVMAITFASSVEKLYLEDNIKTVLRRLCVLYSLHRIIENAGYFVECGALNGEQLALIRQREVDLLGLIRPDAVALVDSFGILDETLCSTLGSYDGNAYERSFSAAKKAAVNKYEVIPGFIEHMKPLQQMSKL